MKLNVVKNENGNVVATFENPVDDGPSIRPILRPGHTVHEVEAEENYNEDIATFYEHHSR
jgi:hypothetical protein